ncbi:MAG TPA: histidine kinase N-terminal 7TM domain-containing protein [Anaerolineae bacterium]|nr:histidine kinase N-terminal 7TM domain-containing protein [Anaerolineae bacterium]
MTGDYVYTPQIWPYLFTAAPLAVLAAYSWRRRTVPGALPLAVAYLLALIWVAGAAAESMTVDPAAKVAWFKFQVAWQLPTVTAITCFVLEYANPGRWLTRRTLALLSLPALLGLILIPTNSLHHWYWLGFSVGTWVEPLPGPGYWVLFAYGMGLILVNLIAFAWLFVRSPRHRLPVALMLVGQITARALHALDVAGGRAPFGLDPVFFEMVIPLGSYAIALFGFRIFDPVPAAGRAALDQMREGMVVFDTAWRALSLNPAAAGILGVPAARVRGKTWPELLPFCPEAGRCLASGGAPVEVSLEGPDRDDGAAGGGARHLALILTPLLDHRALTMGYLLLLHDVTEQRHAQAQIVEQQRALAMLHEREHLARELHDTLGQVFAFVNTQGQTVRRLLGRGDVAAADELVARLVEVAREADLDIRASILGLREPLSERGLFPALAHYLRQVEKNYGVHVELEIPDILTGTPFEPQVEVQLLRIVQEALTNVRRHAQARSVRVAFALEAGWARVTVQDDGQGFDPGARDDGAGKQVGLRVMRERAEGVGGTVRVDSAPGRGTCVTVEVPLRPEASAIPTLREQGAGYETQTR